jgi:antitoxin (DNA-binding transcriptional repressor) of toxin-antitoxin stability system
LRFEPPKSAFNTAPFVIHLRLTLKTASVRDLRNSFPTVARWIEEGESVEITRSGKPFARLAPVPPVSTRAAAMPDFVARMRENFPDETVGSLGSVVDYDRGDR